HDKAGEEALSGGVADGDSDTSRGRVLERQARKPIDRDLAELDTKIFGQLVLEAIGELFVRLVRYHREPVDAESAQAVAVSVDAEPQATADALPPPPLGAHVPQHADLE